VNLCQSPVESCGEKGNCSMEFVWARAQDALIKVLGESALADAYCAGHFPFEVGATVEAARTTSNPTP